MSALIRASEDPAACAPGSSPPALTVAAIVEREGRFLLVEELVRGELVINQPAGHVEPGETLVQAVIRETLEETGWLFRPDSITGIYLWRNPRSGRSFLRVAFSGQVTVHDTERALDAGIVRALWLPRHGLAGRAAVLRSPMVLRGMDDYLDGARRPIPDVGALTGAALLELAQVL